MAASSRVELVRKHLIKEDGDEDVEEDKGIDEHERYEEERRDEHGRATIAIPAASLYAQM